MDTKGSRIVDNIRNSKSSVQEVDSFLKEFPSAINKKFRYRLLGGTLLHWSCIAGNDQIVQHLLSIKDIDLSLTFEDGLGGYYFGFHKKTALEIAQINKNEKIIQLLKEKMNPLPKPQTPTQSTSTLKSVVQSPTPLTNISLDKKPSIQTDITKSANVSLQDKEVLDLKNSIIELNKRFEEWKKLKDNEVSNLKIEILHVKQEKDKEVSNLKVELSSLKENLANVKQEKDKELSNLMKSKDVELTIIKQNINELNEANKLKDKEITNLKKEIHQLRDKFQSFEIDNIEKESTFNGQSLYSFINLSPDEVLPTTLSECLESVFPNFKADNIYSLYYEADMSLFENIKLDDQKWRNEFSTLEKVELESIFLYTIEIPSNKNYQIYSLLNSTLTSPSCKDILPSWKYYLNHLFNGFKKLPIYDISNGYIYRGVGFDLVVFNPEKYQVGKKITFYAFSSCSTNENASREFSKGSGTLFVIKSCISGKSVAKISAYPHEDEILFPPGATFKIEGISNPKVTGCREIVMVQVPSIDKKLAIMAGEKY